MCDAHEPHEASAAAVCVLEVVADAAPSCRSRIELGAVTSVTWGAGGLKLSIICILATSTSAVGTGTVAVDHGSARGVVQLDALFPRLNQASTYVTVMCNGHSFNQSRSDAECMSFDAYSACGTAPDVSGAHFAFAACTAQKTHPVVVSDQF